MCLGVYLMNQTGQISDLYNSRQNFESSWLIESPQSLGSMHDFGDEPSNVIDSVKTTNLDKIINLDALYPGLRKIDTDQTMT